MKKRLLWTVGAWGIGWIAVFLAVYFLDSPEARGGSMTDYAVIGTIGGLFGVGVLMWFGGWFVAKLAFALSCALAIGLSMNGAFGIDGLWYGLAGFGLGIALPVARTLTERGRERPQAAEQQVMQMPQYGDDAGGVQFTARVAGTGGGLDAELVKALVEIGKSGNRHARLANLTLDRLLIKGAAVNGATADEILQEYLGEQAIQQAVAAEGEQPAATGSGALRRGRARGLFSRRT